MNTLKYEKIFAFSILLTTIFSVNPWCRIPIGNLYLEWFTMFIIFFFLFYYIKQNHLFKAPEYRILSIYLVYVIIQIVRGVFIADNYWEYKQLIKGGSALLVPLFIYYFAEPYRLSYIFRHWLKYAFVLLGFFYVWNLHQSSYNFYFAPVLFIGCFIPCIKGKWKYTILISVLILFIIAPYARSQTIKAFMCLLMSFFILYNRYIGTSFVKFFHWGCYIITIVLLVLGLSGKYNFFSDLEKKDRFHSDLTEQNLNEDTRSTIYMEVLTSSIKNDYIVWGRSPARGNDSKTFGKIIEKQTKTGRIERHSNEVGSLNIFTWTGLVGVILYLLIFLKSSYLAVYKSNNIYIKLIGMYIAFRWLYSWIEDFNRFDIMNISLFAMVAMGYSEAIRNMSNFEFKKWINSFLPKRVL